MTTLDPLLDVVIPVHSPTRPLERAVRSIIEQPAADRIRVTVVAHGIAPDTVDRVADPRVRIIAHNDGIASAAGPMNAGLAAATAPYVCRLDSDDTWQPGAAAAWLAAIADHRIDVLMPRLEVDGRPGERNPLTRPGRRHRLDPVRDRLASRTGVFGPVRREYLQVVGAAYDPTLMVGEDLEFGLRLYFGGGRIDGLWSSPGVRIHADAIDRVTLADRSLADELRAVRQLAEGTWARQLPRREREAIAIKLTRIHVMGAVRARAQRSAGPLEPADRASLRAVLEALAGLSPEAAGLITRGEAAELDRARGADPAPQPGRLTGLLATTARRSFSRHSVLRRYAIMKVWRTW